MVALHSAPTHGLGPEVNDTSSNILAQKKADPKGVGFSLYKRFSLLSSLCCTTPQRF
jgi:hypothetical protein